MLNLQSIIEDLGVSCASRAWVVVTSQEDMESILNEMNKTKKEDFSKIQGRFKPPLSLSSANVDEVIQSRLLAKDGGENGDPAKALRQIYSQKGDILKSQLTFKNCGMTKGGLIALQLLPEDMPKPARPLDDNRGQASLFEFAVSA